MPTSSGASSWRLHSWISIFLWHHLSYKLEHCTGKVERTWNFTLLILAQLQRNLAFKKIVVVKATQGSLAAWQAQLYLEAATQRDNNTEAGGRWVSQVLSFSKIPSILINHKGARRAPVAGFKASTKAIRGFLTTLLWRDEGYAN